MIDLCKLKGTDIREIAFYDEFDVVLNLADGAIGYLENEEENQKIFDIICRALKAGGQHVCDLVCGDYACAHFPVKLWEAGEHAVSLSEFDWNPDTCIMMFGNQDFAYGETMTKPEITEGDPTRVYTLAEIKEIMEKRDMEVVEAFFELVSRRSINMRYNWIDEYLLSKKGVTKNLENWNWIRYQIGEKMFVAVCCDEAGVPYCITLKLEPNEGAFLREQYKDIYPGHYMNKVHWNSINPDGEVPDDLLKDLLDKSYGLILAGFSKKKQAEILAE